MGKLEQSEPLWTIDELARYLNVPKSWLYEQSRLRKHNGFPVIKCGKYLRFDRRKVLDWLANNDD